MDKIGYAHLVDKFKLPAMPLAVTCIASDAVNARRISDLGGQTVEYFARSYEPDTTVLDHLRFALRYEGVNLQVLKLLFDAWGDCGLQAAVKGDQGRPPSPLERRLGFLYEWLTGRELIVPENVAGRRKYEPVLNEDLQFGLSQEASERNEKFRVWNNLPGDQRFCPLVRKTARLKEMTDKDLAARVMEKISACDQELLSRATDYLFLKETYSSFEVEHVKPSATKAQRFISLLHKAESGLPMTLDRFVELQNAVVEQRKVEASWRQEQNWIGSEYRNGWKKASFVPPRPDELPSIMDGLMSSGNRLRKNVASTGNGGIDPVVATAAISFGFVFAHPFLDGNGRLHRYLIHDQLTTLGFTPHGFILPVSAVVLASKKRYNDVLESFSRPLLERTEFDPNLPEVSATGNDAIYFRYFDATAAADFLYEALEHTIETDLDKELKYLMGFDRAKRALDQIGDWSGQEADLFINLVMQNNGKLSETKRKSRFPLLNPAEIERYEAVVTRAFDGTNH